MIEYIKQDITKIKRGVVAHGCNCQGVMGSGAAAAVKATWPRAFERYKVMVDRAKARGLVPADLLGVALIVNVDPTSAQLFVSNMLTQVTYGRDGRRYADPRAIHASLIPTVSFAEGAGLPLYTVKIGGLRGGLDWDSEVRPIFEEVHEQFPSVPFFVCDQ